MSKFGKMIVAAALVLIIVAAAVWFFVIKDDGTAYDPNAGVNNVTTTTPSGNSVTVKDTLEDTSSDKSTGGDGTIQLPPLDPDGSGLRYPPDESTGGEDDILMVNEDGIPTPEAIQLAQQTDKNLYGRLVIPLAGINVRLYQSTDARVIQAEDSASLFTLHDATIIADMWKQGFSNLQSLTNGSEMYIVTHIGTTHYKCSRSEKGSVGEAGLVYADGSSSSDAPRGAITCYAQMNNAGDIWIVEFTDDGTTSSTGAGNSENGGGNEGGEPTGDGQSSGISSNGQSEPTKEPEDWTGGAGYNYTTQD